MGGDQEKRQVPIMEVGDWGGVIGGMLAGGGRQLPAMTVACVYVRVSF